MPQHLPLREFLNAPGPILDVRTSAEYIQGHLPHSHSFPLFTQEERAQIGTVYKKQCKNDAIELGLLLILPKLEMMMSNLASLLGTQGNILCWRGGMRSGFTARLAELIGIRSTTLQGGYKTYRRWALSRLSRFYFPSLRVVAGLTGSGKTAILNALFEQGEQVIDLEKLAGHRGSAFGGIGLPPQSSQEQFENELASLIESFDPSKPVWIEDESRLIGSCHLPETIYQSILNASLIYIDKSPDERVQNLLIEYGTAPYSQLLASVDCIAKRLGSERTKEVKQAIEAGRIDQAFEKLLYYYDKAYQNLITKRRISSRIKLPKEATLEEWAAACKN